MKKSVIFVLIALLLFSCKGTKNGVEKRVVTVTAEPFRYFTERIAGDRFSVNTMVPSGSSPETYEPSAQQMADLAKSDLYIKVGSIGFERTWIKKLEANAPHAIFVDASEGIVPEASADGIEDPHTWMSAANAVVISKNIYRSLASIDSRDSLYFKQNLESLLADIANVDNEVRRILKNKKTKAFLIYHPILTYFARDYGLTQIPLEQEGREPSAAQLKNVITEAKGKKVGTLFVQKEFGNRNVDVIAKSVGAKKVRINPLGYDWPKEMVDIANKLE